MLLERLDLLNVRNIAAAQLRLCAGANLLVGPNGAGKTALLEAVYLLFCGRSFRSNRTEGLVRHGETGLSVAATCRDAQLGEVRLVHRRDRGRLELRRDAQVVRQTSAVAALLPIQLLLPDVAELVFGLPALRRQWLDWGAFHGQPAYAATHRRYLRALRHRNVLLREGELATLPQWTGQVAELGEEVAMARRAYFEEVTPMVAECLAALDPGVAVEAGYEPGWTTVSLADALAQGLERDIRTGTTNAGPHRGDVRIVAEGQAAAGILSRGQGKIVASALRLAQARHLMASERPSLFLIDDVGAELDATHSERFFSLLGEMGCQILATSARHEAPRAMSELRTRLFHVEHGQFHTDD